MILIKLVNCKYHQSGKNQSNFPQCAPCDHNSSIQLFEEEIKILCLHESSIMDEMDRIKEIGQDLGTFFQEFASKYPDNSVTALVEDLNDEQWTHLRDQETKLSEVRSDLDRCHRKLFEVQEDARKNECQCLKNKVSK